MLETEYALYTLKSLYSVRAFTGNQWSLWRRGVTWDFFLRFQSLTGTTASSYLSDHLYTFTTQEVDAHRQIYAFFVSPRPIYSVMAKAFSYSLPSFLELFAPSITGHCRTSIGHRQTLR